MSCHFYLQTVPWVRLLPQSPWLPPSLGRSNLLPGLPRWPAYPHTLSLSSVLHPAARAGFLNANWIKALPQLPRLKRSINSFKTLYLPASGHVSRSISCHSPPHSAYSNLTEASLGSVSAPHSSLPKDFSICCSVTATLFPPTPHITYLAFKSQCKSHFQRKVFLNSQYKLGPKASCTFLHPSR